MIIVLNLMAWKAALTRRLGQGPGRRGRAPGPGLTAQDRPQAARPAREPVTPRLRAESAEGSIPSRAGLGCTVTSPTVGRLS
jgi:hypothetical protein